MSAGGISSIYLAGNYHTSGTGKYIFQIVLGGTILGCLETTLGFLLSSGFLLISFFRKFVQCFNCSVSARCQGHQGCWIHVGFRCNEVILRNPLELKLSGLPPVALRAKAWEKLRGLLLLKLATFQFLLFLVTPIYNMLGGHILPPVVVPPLVDNSHAWQGLTPYISLLKVPFSLSYESFFPEPMPGFDC